MIPMAKWRCGSMGNSQHISAKAFHAGSGFTTNSSPGLGGEGIRWNDEKHASENLHVPAAKVDRSKAFAGAATRRLKINFLWVLLYITKAPQNHVSKIWFDNIVVAKEYIGPMKANK